MWDADAGGDEDGGGGGAGVEDVFVVKLDPGGTPLWAVTFGGPANDRVESLAVGVTGVVVTGSYAGTADFGGGPIAAGSPDASLYLVALDPDGSYVWGRVFDADRSAVGTSVDMDADGNVILLGSFSDARTDVGGGPLESESGGGFLAKYDPEGQHVWSQLASAAEMAVDDRGRVVTAGWAPDSAFGLSWYEATGSPTDTLTFPIDGGFPWDVAAGAAGAAFCASFWGTVDFGGGPLPSRPSPGAETPCVASFDADGAHAWSRSSGTGGNGQCRSVSMDASGEVAIGGGFYGSLDWGGTPIANAGAIGEAYVARFDPAGGNVFGRSFPGTENAAAVTHAEIDGARTVVAGSFRGSLALDGETLVSAGELDGWACALDAAGAVTWSLQFGDAARQIVNALAVDADGNVFLAGVFQGDLGLP